MHGCLTIRELLRRKRLARLLSADASVLLASSSSSMLIGMSSGLYKGASGDSSPTVCLLIDWLRSFGSSDMMDVGLVWS